MWIETHRHRRLLLEANELKPKKQPQAMIRCMQWLIRIWTLEQWITCVLSVDTCVSCRCQVHWIIWIFPNWKLRICVHLMESFRDLWETSKNLWTFLFRVYVHNHQWQHDNLSPLNHLASVCRRRQIPAIAPGDRQHDHLSTGGQRSEKSNKAPTRCFWKNSDRLLWGSALIRSSRRLCAVNQVALLSVHRLSSG